MSISHLPQSNEVRIHSLLKEISEFRSRRNRKGKFGRLRTIFPRRVLLPNLQYQGLLVFDATL